MRAVAAMRYREWRHVYLACDGKGGFNDHREYLVCIRMQVDDSPPDIMPARPVHIQASNGTFSWTLNPHTLVNQAKRALLRCSGAGLLARALACEALGFDSALLVGATPDFPCPFCKKLPEI